jgi:hypothetical protein
MTFTLLGSAEYTGVCGRRCGSSPYLFHGFTHNWWLLTSDTMGMASFSSFLSIVYGSIALG